MGMRYFLLLFILFLLALPLKAQDYDGFTIDNISIRTNRMSPDIIKKRFYLKEGDTLTKQSFERAQDRLHAMRMFKDIQFKAEPKENNKVDISINANDGYYFFPMAFATGGDKNAMGLFVAEGNYFKKAENAFIFAAGSNDAVTLSSGLVLNGNVYNFKFSKLNFDQRFYTDGWSSNYGVLSTADDKGKYGTPEDQIYTRTKSFSFTYIRPVGFAALIINPTIETADYDSGVKNGSHNKLSIGLKKARNMPPGANMGALFGFGLSDKAKALKDLPQTKYGYSLTALYTGGGNWTGADFDINKFEAEGSFLAEFENRNMFLASVKAEQSINATLNESVRSVDLLEGAATYNRQILGSRGIGFSAAYTWYLLRNNTGMLAVEPFYQLAYVYQKDRYFDHSGTGITAFYKFWRFPFPLGINFTRNLSDNSNKASFFLGAAF